MSGSRGTANFVWRCTQCKVRRGRVETRWESLADGRTDERSTEGTLCQLYRP